MKAFGRGEIDLAYIGLPPAIIGIDQGIKVLCVAGGHVEGTVLAAKTQCRGFPGEPDPGQVLRQFRGRSVGVPGKGSIHDVILKDFIGRYGLESEIEVKNYPWADLVLEAVMTDEVAAAMGTPALAAAIRRFAAGEVLLPPSMLWPYNPSYGIVADRLFLAREPGAVELFLRLHEEATAALRKEPQETARVIADYVGIVDNDFVLDTLLISPKYCSQLSPEYIESTMKFIPVMMRLGYIRSEISKDRIFYRDLIDKIHPEKDHYGEGIPTDK
jgi:NitT/TauT family transport system substrate-binding protein